MFWLYKVDSSEALAEQNCTLQEWVEVVTDTREKVGGVRGSGTWKTGEDDKESILPDYRT